MLQIWVLLQNALMFYCTLWIDQPDGKTAAVARNVSFAEITCHSLSTRIS